MTYPEWADPHLSQKLPGLCASDEGQTLEFKRELPPQKRDFAKSIAALASTSGGLILVGVANDGSVSGVPGADAASVRDELCARVAGLCQQIEPPVRPNLVWAVVGGSAVLVVQVDKGIEPLYFVDGRGYVRHANISRPATPAEIKAAFAPPPKAGPSVDRTLSDLANLLAEVMRWCDIDLQMRTLRPWMDEWSHVAEYSSGQLREMAVSDWGMKDGRGGRLLPLADQLDEIAHNSQFSGRDFEELCREAGTMADQLMKEFVWAAEFDVDSQAAARLALATFGRQLDAMWTRAAENFFDGRVEKAQEEASTIGKRIADWTYLPLPFFDEEIRPLVRQTSIQIIELASMRTYYDGGESQSRIVARGRELTDQLNDLLKKL